MIENRESTIEEKFKKEGLEIWILGHPVHVFQGNLPSYERWEWTVVKDAEDDFKMLRTDLDYPEAITDTRENRILWLEKNYLSIIRDCKDDLDKGLGLTLEDIL